MIPVEANTTNKYGSFDPMMFVANQISIVYILQKLLAVPSNQIITKHIQIYINSRLWNASCAVGMLKRSSYLLF